MEEEGGYYGWKVVGSGGRGMTAIFKSMCLWFSYLKLPGPAEYNHVSRFMFAVPCSRVQGV